MIHHPTLTIAVGRDGAVTVVGPLRHRILSELWDGGPGCLSALVLRLNADGDARATTTISTTLARLVDEGLVVRTDRRAYAAAITRAQLNAQIRARLEAALAAPAYV